MKPLSPVFTLVFLLLSGCAAMTMQEAAEQTPPPVTPEKALLVFLRPPLAGNDSPVSVYDVTSGNPFFIGMLTRNTKVYRLTDPGRRTFMVVVEAADFMQAELAAGKTFYGLVTPAMEAGKARFPLQPVKNDPASEFNTASGDFARWLASAKLVQTTPAAEQWARDNNADVLEKYHESWPKWLGKTLAEKERLTLHPADGR